MQIKMKCPTCNTECEGFLGFDQGTKEPWEYWIYGKYDDPENSLSGSMPIACQECGQRVRVAGYLRIEWVDPNDPELDLNLTR